MIAQRTLVSNKHTHTQAEAWELAISCQAWIWKCIYQRNIPLDDMEDCYNTCLIEVYNLMLQYNPRYSKLAWAKYGIMKGMLKHGSTSGTVRLPMHIVDKMNRLHRLEAEYESRGERMTIEEMEEITGMKIEHIVTAQEKFRPVRHSDNHDTPEFFYNMQSESLYQQSEMDIPDTVALNESTEILYDVLEDLEDESVFILALRFNLDRSRIPFRYGLRFGGPLDLTIADEKEHCLQSIADLLGVSKERIRQKQNLALKEINNLLRQRV